MSCSEDDDNSLMGDEPGENLLSSPPQEEEEEEDDDDDEVVEAGNTLYMYFNKTPFKVPKATDTTGGWTRNYNRTYKVKSGETLGLLAKGDTEAWAPLQKVTVDKVVVLKGKMKQDDDEMHYTWYLLIEVEGSSPDSKSDHLILRHIPKTVYKKIWNSLLSNDEMRDSSLLKQQAYQENAKGLNPILNGLQKCAPAEVPKSAAIDPPTKSAKKTIEVNADDEARPVKKSKNADGGANGKPAAKKAASSKKAGSSEQPPEQEPEPEVTASTSSFFVPKAGAKAAPEEAARAAEAEGEPAGSAEPAPKAAPKAAKNNTAGGKSAGKASTKELVHSVTVRSEFLVCDEEADSVTFMFPKGLKPTGGEVQITYTFK